MPSIDLPQGTIEYFDEGDPAGTPVVAVHGVLTSAELWASTSAALGERVRMLRPTLPLGSHRTPVHGTPSPRDVAATLLAFLDELGLEDPVLLGNDSGGAICQLAIHAQPERVRRLVLTNCDAFDEFPPFPFSLLLPMSKVPGLITAMMQGTRVPALRHALLYGLLSSGRHEQLWRRSVEPFLADRAIRRQAVGIFRQADPAELLAATNALASWGGEALVVWGMRDRFFRPELGRRLAAVLDAPFVEVPDAKTFVCLDAPEALADAVAGFAAGVPSPALSGS